MRAFKNVIAVLLAAALIVGVVLYVMHENRQSDQPAISGKVVINEFMASNGGYLPDDKGNYSDWIELYNASDEDVALSGMGLSDEKNDIKWIFPNVTLPAGGYVVVFASGKSATNPDKQLHTNFKLNAESGGIYLTDAAGQIIDQVEYTEQVRNMSMGRRVDDMSVWEAFSQPSPGFANDEAGAQAFMQTRYADAGTSPLQITEVMASNKTTLPDNTGEYCDYIEIYNSGEEAIGLLGYGLSDDPLDPLDWKFPDVTIQPGQYLVVFASSKDAAATDLEAGFIHTNFGISAYKETIVLSTPKGLIIDEVTVGEASADMTWARTPGDDGIYTDEWAASGQPSPGYENTRSGYEQFTAANPIALGDIIISEVMTSNSQYLGEDGDYYDWIELYNQGTETINLAGWGLTDNTGNPAKWRLPDVSVAPGQYVTVMASGLDVKKNYIHTNFKLSAEGEVLALFDPSGHLCDRYNIGRLPYGVSIGRMPGQTMLSYFQTPTPGAANASPSAGIVDTPSASVAGGLYDAGQQVTLTCGTQGAVIYYTTDGTEPTQSSMRYTGPISVEKTGMIRARAFKDGYLESAVFTATYIIGANHSLPVVSIVTDPANLWDEQTGIYVLGPNPQLVEGSTQHYEVANYLWRGRESERPASFEVYGEDGQTVFQEDVAIRIQGGYSRDNQQKSFSIIARNEYGSNMLAYPFFENRPFTEYKSIVLRCGGQDALYAKIKEAVILKLLDGNVNCLLQGYKTYVLYLNGEYWGVYFMQEKRSENFVAQHEDYADPDSINLIVGSGISSDSRHLINGTNEEYKALLNYVTTHDMSLKENYDYLAERLDTDSFMDLMINQIYVANSDYANIQFYQIPGGKWKQIFYDMCWAFREPTHETLAARLKDSTTGSTMFSALLQYQPWKEAFLKRFAETMEKLYQTDHFISVIDEVAASVADEMPAERAKFTDAKTNWEDAVEKMRVFAKERPANMLKQLKSVLGVSGSELRSYFTLSDEELKAGFYLSDEQMQSLFG